MNAIKAKHLLEKGATGYLLTMINYEKEAVLLKDIPVACEFEDVFPTELPGLSPQREIDFRIEVESGSTPFSKTPYRMAPIELKELRV